MKQHLNTLFVTSQGSYLAKEGEAVVVRLEGKTRLRVPVHNLEGIVCFGNVGASPFLLGHCGEKGVRVSFLTENGRFLARVEGPVSGNVLLRREQYRRSDDRDGAAGIARSLLFGKLSSCRSVLLRAARDHPGADGRPEILQAAENLAVLLRRAQECGDLDSLRGLEGGAGREYFGVFDHLIIKQKDDFSFAGRNRRPPLDAVNSLLSFFYTLLVHDASGALESVGLDPAVGFLHRDRPGRPSLALDLIEELRPVIADRLVLSLINLESLKPRDFVQRESGAVFLTDDARKKVLVAYQKRKADTLTHPFLGTKTTFGMILHLQALLLARFLRGDLDAYPAFLWK